MTAYEILDSWIRAIEKRNLEQVLALYAPTAILIPTFSDTILNSPAKIRRYFERLMGRQSLQISVHGKTLQEQAPSPGISVLSGIYTWKFLVEEELITYEARFSFILDLQAKAPILHHHSSQIPRAV